MTNHFMHYFLFPGKLLKPNKIGTTGSKFGESAQTTAKQNRKIETLKKYEARKVV